MIMKGQTVVVIDPDLRDMYCAESVRTQESKGQNILVKIRYMIQYPIQHAIIYPDLASENAPIPAGKVCRLRFVRYVSTHDGLYSDYEATFDRCLEAYAARRRRLYDADARSTVKRYHVDPREFEILDRHRRRQFDKPRVVISV